MNVQLFCGDCLEVMPTLDANSVDSIVCDPPYGLSFMGKDWDHGVPGVAFWEAALRVAKPGAHLLAFGGDRTHHRMMVAIEDAGWEIRTCLYWCFGSGFPKSLDIGKQLDKTAPRAGMFDAFAQHYKERRIAQGLKHSYICAVGGFYAEHNHGGASVNWESGYNVPTREQWEVLQPLLGLSLEWLPLIERIEAEREVVGKQSGSIRPGFSGDRYGEVDTDDFDITAPATDAAKQWQGWGTALKPAVEIIVMARKPLIGTVAANVQAWGCAGINVDACRIGTNGGGTVCNNRDVGGHCMGHPTANGSLGGGIMRHAAAPASPQGRWPANLLLDPEAAALLDEMSGERPNGGSVRKQQKSTNGYEGGWGDRIGYFPHDTGGASRFFARFAHDEDDAPLRFASEPLCALCNCPCNEKHGIMNEKGDTIPCAKSANNAGTNSSPRTTIKSNGSVALNAQDSGRPSNEDRAAQSSAPASNAAKSTKDLQANESISVPTSAEEKRSAQIAQSVKSAGNLCDLCATSIAAALVALQQAQSPESILGQAFMPEHKRQILTQCLASFVALLGNTDTIPTMDSLNLLFGSVHHAIASYTLRQDEQAANQQCHQSRLKYCSKASKRDRDEGLEGMEERAAFDNPNGNMGGNMGSRSGPRANHHPTVKPTALCRWLVRLVTPPNGTILDPFCGSGSTGKAAMLEGFNFIGVELDEEYLTIARRRIEHAQGQAAQQQATMPQLPLLEMTGD